MTWEFLSIIICRCVPDGYIVAQMGAVVPLSLFLLLFVMTSLILAWKLHNALKILQRRETTSSPPREEIVYRTILPTDTTQDNKNTVIENQRTVKSTGSMEATPIIKRDFHAMLQWPEDE